ncbi:MAG TPA: hypothetical protein PLY87_13490 [Planctomycetaceae bacterium]|nr:hypothetical protein [Planctomycetaceae bacterium]HQZ66094.1 hypothetical protein [Planctomycetaceae bacterium]HRA86624.1 hypothetical protein [Planctomycetaceae bacterium]
MRSWPNPDSDRQSARLLRPREAGIAARRWLKQTVADDSQSM